ncbi:MAG: hypothetical protein ACYDHD_11650, partial [Vulcanimicrobiaceae bacterium]
VELAVPVLDPMLAETIASSILSVTLADNCKSRELQADGTYIRSRPEAGEPPIDSQQIFLKRAQAL